jgi:hypothetical protein
MFLSAFDATPKEVPTRPRAFLAAINAMLDHEVFGTKQSAQKEQFAEFVRNRVVLFKVEMPLETDVSAYFEIMNSRGVQLEFHELLKAKLMSRLPQESNRVLFDQLWTACAGMSGHLLDRLPESIGDELLKGAQSWMHLDGNHMSFSSRQHDGEEERAVIPDFPNFLMHVLRVYTRNGEVPLDERNIRDVFENYLKEGKIDAVDFMDTLLKLRIRFDKLVIKAADGEIDRELEWRLEGEGGWSPGDKARLIHLESMLQVTYPSRRNKSWVFEVLASEVVDAPTLIALLENLVRKRLNDVVSNDGGWARKGTGTSHLLLNAIDYLLYCNNPEAYSGDKRFRFAYRNTVEHHFPVGSASESSVSSDDATEQWTKENVNDIGNLYLLAQSDNSSLSVRDPWNKVKLVKERDKLPPKRREMYDLTEKDKTWTPRMMREHSERVRVLLDAFLQKEANSKSAD